MTDITAGLVKLRAELAGEASVLRAQIARIVVDLGHLDAVIRQFDGVPPRRQRRADAAPPGEMSRYLLGVLRDSKEPLSTIEIAQRFMTDWGIDVADARAVRRVGMTLSHERAKGMARSQAVLGKVALWTVAG